jgi:hypothetical protein
MVRVVGTTDADELAGLKEADVILGGGGDDALFGWDGEDRIEGGGGNDYLIDGFGIDTLVGGAGADTFRLSRDGDRDIVRDFGNGLDRIDVSALGARSMADVTLRAVAAGVLVIVDGERTLVSGAQMADFSADSFVFSTGRRFGFDNLSSADDHSGLISPEDVPYQGLIWENFGFLETDEDTNPSGYIATSGDNVAYNDASNTGTIRYEDFRVFDLESAMMSAAWRLDLNLAVTGYLGKANVGTQFFVLNPDNPELLQFDDAIFDHVTTVEFTTFGGTYTDTTAFDARQFSLDDLVLL